MGTDRSRLRRSALVMGSVLLLIVVLTAQRPPLLLYNRTASVPVGLYVWCGNAPRRGDLVAFSLPAAAHAYAQARGDSTDVLLLKLVLAAAGDRVSTLHGEVRIDGASVGAVPDTDSGGRSLPQYPMDRALADNELFVGSTRTAHSFDSRFFGPVHAAQIVGVYRPLWLHTPPTSAAASSAATSQSSPPCNVRTADRD